MTAVDPPRPETARYDTLRLGTERLVLRPVDAGDVDAVFALYADPEVMRYWSTPPWTDRERAVAFVEETRRSIASGEAVHLVLEPRGAPGTMVGACTLFAFAPGSRRAEIGYLMARAAWGRGLMHEALTALVDHAFGPLDLNRIEADIDPRNDGSRRTLERLGFVHEGTLRERWIVAGEVSDTGMYGLLRRDWEGRRPDRA